MALGLAILAVGARARAEPESELARLMVLRQQVQSSKAHFTERKYLSLLTVPIESSGTLSYERPDRLEKLTLVPSEERLGVAGDDVTVEAAGQSRSMKLSSSPELTVLIECIRATLAGDLPALERYFELEFRGTVDKWELRLIPRDERTRAVVRDIRIAGRGRSIETIDTEEVGGDRTLLSIVEDAP